MANPNPRRVISTPCPPNEAPSKVVELALRAVKCIGDGLNRVDIKLPRGNR